MNSDTYFSECLNNLMKVVGLKNSKLAKAINVDASLIYKWLNNKAIPPYDSHHIDLIANEIMKNIMNSYQFNQIECIIKDNLGDNPEINPNNLTVLIKKLLKESQGYSIEKKKKINTMNQYSNSNNININSLELFQKNNALGGNSNYSNVQIISGHKEVLNAVLKLLDMASQQKNIPDDPMMITSLSEFNNLHGYPDFNEKWKTALTTAINKGWGAVYLANVNNQISHSIKVIENMLIPVSTGRYQIYYTYFNQCIPFFEILIVPDVGVLYCISNMNKHQVDSAMFIKDKNAVSMFKGYFSQLLKTSKPLLNTFNNANNVEYENGYSGIEEMLGNRYIVKWGLNTLSIPINLYEKNIMQLDIPTYEMEKKISVHKRKIKAFETQIKHYKYRDIIAEDYLTDLINGNINDFYNKTNIYGEIILSKENLIERLSNTILLLKKYDNYEIGLSSHSQIDFLSTTDLLIKENAMVLLFTLPHESNFLIQPERYFAITEPNIIKAYEYYADNLWNNIKPINRNKKELILKLEYYIRILSGLQK